jgi:hypothetical protein
MPARIQSFEEFWPFYVGEHRHPLNRALHYAGTSAALCTAAAGVCTLNPLLIAAAPVVGYGPAWIGHFLVEGNRPASFTYPLWSFRADMKMLGLAVRGKMSAEVTRLYGSCFPAPDAPLLSPV